MLTFGSATELNLDRLILGGAKGPRVPSGRATPRARGSALARAYLLEGVHDGTFGVGSCGYRGLSLSSQRGPGPRPPNLPVVVRSAGSSSIVLLNRLARALLHIISVLVGVPLKVQVLGLNQLPRAAMMVAVVFAARMLPGHRGLTLSGATRWIKGLLLHSRCILIISSKLVSRRSKDIQSDLLIIIALIITLIAALILNLNCSTAAWVVILLLYQAGVQKVIQLASLLLSRRRPRSPLRLRGYLPISEVHRLIRVVVHDCPAPGSGLLHHGARLLPLVLLGL